MSILQICAVEIGDIAMLSAPPSLTSGSGGVQRDRLPGKSTPGMLREQDEVINTAWREGAANASNVLPL